MSIDRFLISLDQTLITTFKATTDEGRSLLKVLSSGGIGNFKWDLKEKVIWFSETMYDVCGLDKDFHGSFFELLQLILDKEYMFKFIRQIMEIYENPSNGNIDIDIYSSKYKENRYVRISYDFQNDDELIIGTIQDIHELKLAKVEAVDLSDRLIQILKGVPLPLYYYDHVGNMIFTNESIEKPLEYFNPLIEKHIHDIKDELENCKEIIEFDIKSYDPTNKKYRIKVNLNDKIIILLIHRIQIKRSDETVGILFIHEDVTEDFEQEHKIQKVLKTNELTIKIKDIVDQDVDIQVLYDFVLKHISSVIPSVKRACILKIDHQNNLYMAANYGYDKNYQQRLKMPFKETFAFTSFNLDYSKSIIINDIQTKFAVQYSDLNKNQNGFTMESNMTAPIMISNKLYGLLSVDSDINQIFDPVDLNLIDYISIQLERSITKHNLLTRYKTESISDPLTGVFNRRHLMEVFDSLILKGIHESKTFALVIFDIDDLKVVNDVHGHLVGDVMLKLFTMKVLKSSRSDDILSRYGGDEFVGLFWDISMKDLLNRIDLWQEELMKEMVVSSDPDLHLNFSYGVSLYPSDGSDFDELLNMADQRMYSQKKSKKKGR